MIFGMVHPTLLPGKTMKPQKTKEIRYNNREILGTSNLIFNHYPIADCTDYGLRAGGRIADCADYGLWVLDDF